MDRRIVRTRQAIIGAMRELLKRQEYQEITVSDIIKKANVGRSTFYENFLNKDEVFDEILEGLSAHVFDEIEHKDGHAFQNNLRGEITHLYIHIREGEGATRAFLRGKSADVFYERMGEKVAHILDEKLTSPVNLPSALFHAHISSTFSDVLKYWASRNFSDSPEIIADYFLFLSNEIFS